jgi:subtilisin family serine protease
MLFPIEKPFEKSPATFATRKLLVALIISALTLVLRGPRWIARPFSYFLPVLLQALSGSRLLVNQYTSINLSQARAFDTPASELRGLGTRIAILDSGVRPTHAAFWRRVVLERNFTSDNGGWPQDAWDTHGHGSHVSGIAAGSSTAALPGGIAPDAEIIAVKILDRLGRGSMETLADALDWVSHLVPRVDVVNLSLGDLAAYLEPRLAIHRNRTYRRIAAAVNRLERNGTVIVAAAGNGFYALWRYGHSFPAVLSDVVPAGALFVADYGPQSHYSGWVANSTKPLQIAPFSQRLPATNPSSKGQTLFAPGARLLSAGHTSDIAVAEAQGTSQAAPMVSGVCLLLIEYYVRKTGNRPSPGQVRDAIRFASSSNVVKHSKIIAGSDPAEDDNAMGPLQTDFYVRLDALAALNRMKQIIGP